LALNEKMALTRTTGITRPEELITLEDAHRIVRYSSIPADRPFIRRHFTDKQAVNLARIILATSRLPIPNTDNMKTYLVSEPADIVRVTAAIDNLQSSAADVSTEPSN
jgi:hypothetical protein